MGLLQRSPFDFSFFILLKEVILVAWRQGSYYIGTDSIKTSTSNQEIIPPPKEGHTVPTNCYKFSFRNLDDCRVQINNGNTLFLAANQGFNVDDQDPPIWSFIILDANIQYNWIAKI